MHEEYPYLAVAVTPVFVGGNEKTGATQLLARIRMLVGGEVEDVPYIPGNSVRGKLRRLAFRDWLQRIGYTVNVDTRGGLMLYHSLFAGGVLESSDEGAVGEVDLELKRRILDLIPPARLFGMAVGNVMIEGRLATSMMLPVAVELRDYLPPEVAEKARLSFYEMLGTVFQTRRDEIRAPRREDEQAVQMLVEYEVFNPGTPFYGWLALHTPTELDRAALAVLADLWTRDPQVGGRARLGFGRLRITWLRDPRDPALAEAYARYVVETREQARQLLDELAEVLGGGKKKRRKQRREKK